MDSKLRTDNKPSFSRLFTEFCDEVGYGNPVAITDTLYDRFVVEDFAYSDDATWFGVAHYLRTKVLLHKVEVFKAGANLFPLIPEHYRIYHPRFLQSLVFHDLSKFSAVEALGYSGWNFETSSGDKAGFYTAWNHHIHHNEHHPEHWLLPNRGGDTTPLIMPKVFVVEMVADWFGAGKTYGKSLEAWLPDNLHKFKFHPDVLPVLQEVLNCVGVSTKIEKDFLHV